jgi:DNA-binding SARP family transcriptional activator
MNHSNPVEWSPAAAALVHQALAEQRVLADTIAQLLGAIDDRQARAALALDQALEMSQMDRTGLLSPVASSRCTVAAHARTGRVQVYCLGVFRIVVDGSKAGEWHSSKARALLQYLVNHRHRPIPRDRLIEALWPDPSSATPGTSLKVTVHALRQMLAQTGPGQSPLTIQSHESSYQLSAPDLWLDVEEFEGHFALARRLDAAGREAEALIAYARAAELYGGDFLEESWDDWVVFRREALRDQFLFTLARLADGALTAADYRGCVLWCQRLLEMDRCREETYRTLMLCHARMGQRGRVRCWYELCVKTLQAELDVAPEEATRTLYRRAMNGGV